MASLPHYHPGRGIYRICARIVDFTHAVAVWQADSICAHGDRRDREEDKLRNPQTRRNACPFALFFFFYIAIGKM